MESMKQAMCVTRAYTPDWNYLPTLPDGSEVQSTAVDYLVSVCIPKKEIRYTTIGTYNFTKKCWYIHGYYHENVELPAEGETKYAMWKHKGTIKIEAWSKLPAPVKPKQEGTPVTTVCYGQERSWRSKQEAIDFFLEGIDNSEGSERQRYENIVLKLQNGETYATDAD